MLNVYLVDVRRLPPTEIVALYGELDGASHFTECYNFDGGCVGLVVHWDKVNESPSALTKNYTGCRLKDVSDRDLSDMGRAFAAAFGESV